VEFEPRRIDCGFLTLQTCLNDMMELNGGNVYKVWHLGKQALLREFGYIPRRFRATDEALQVYQLFTGDGGEIHDSEEDNSDAGAGDGAVDQMIIPIEAVWSRYLREKTCFSIWCSTPSIKSIRTIRICNNF
jgi:hypothetical protein